MPINVKDLSEMFGKDVFSSDGNYCGQVVDVQVALKRFRLRGLTVEAAKGSQIANMLGRKRGLVIPYTLVEAIGDIVITKPITTSSLGDEEGQQQEEAQQK